MFVIYNGAGLYFLVAVDVKVWWKWGYWLSPMMYGHNGLSVNEFLGNKWNSVSSLKANQDHIFWLIIH